jgi:S-DNA-T family DNA segregation ATPase FtsK/SpoIIIE
MRDFTRNISDDDLNDARLSRNAGVNRPDLDFGMDDDGEDDWESGSSSSGGWGEDFGSQNDSFGGSSFGNDRFGGDNFGGSSFGGGGFNSGGFGGSSFGGGFNGGGMGGGFSQQYGTPNQMNQNQQMMNPEDKFWNGVGNFFKGCFGFIKELIDSFKDFDTVSKMRYFKNLGYVSGIVGAIAGLLFIAGLGSYAYQILVSSIFGLATFVIGFMWQMETLKKHPELARNTVAVEANNYPEDYDNNDFGSEDIDDTEFGNDDNSSVNTDYEGLWDDLDNGRDEIEIEDPIIEEPKIEEPKSPEEALREVQLKNTMMTRQYIYEKMIPCLENNKPNFADEEIYDEDDNRFLGMCSIVQKAGNLVATKTASEMPEVVSVKDKLFYTEIKVTRPNWLKEGAFNKFVKEIRDMCAFNEDTNESDESVTVAGTLNGDEAYIKVMKGETAAVTLKDTFDKVKDKVLDVKNVMPLVLGINAKGDVEFMDFESIHGLFLMGAPRTGKSWTVKAILAQLMMFLSPKELQLYLVDPKHLTSDFYTVDSPHIRKFIPDDETLMSTLKFLVEDEAKRREKLLFETGGYVNIKDFKKDHPEIELPYLYIIIDEIMTISQRMDKETRAAFFAYLKQFVSRLPSYGIRLIMVPHLVKNNVVDKSVTDMLPNKICVKADTKTVEEVMDVSGKEFPYRLTHTGDLAVKLNDRPKPFFVHSVIVSTSNSGYDKFFSFIRNFWLKTQPESFKGSKLESDLKSGMRSVSAYPILKEIGIDISEFEEIENNKKANRVQRPNSPKFVIEDISETEGVTLNDSETNSILKNLHNDVDSHVNRFGIQKDDSFM